MTSACFSPLSAPNAKVLILGTLPGTLSLKENQYYAHPRNAFWVLMENVFGINADLPYAERARRLIEWRVALWDVVAVGDRTGSLDVNIKDETPNNFVSFYAAHPDIKHVYFNGAKAAKIYADRVLPTLESIDIGLGYNTLPSTSPAHAVGIGKKLEQWLAVHRHLSRPLTG